MFPNVFCVRIVYCMIKEECHRLPVTSYFLMAAALSPTQPLNNYGGVLINWHLSFLE